jgi:hypothetical protein
MVDISNGTRHVSYCLLSPFPSDDFVDACTVAPQKSVTPLLTALFCMNSAALKPLKHTTKLYQRLILNKPALVGGA